MGISRAPREDTSAMAEPEIPPNSMDASTFTCASPPVICPTHTFAKASRRLDIPPAAMISPIRMKKGIASSENELSCLDICCTRVMTGTWIYSMVKAVDIIIEKVIGHLIIISSTKVMRRIAIAIFGFILFPPPLC